MPNGTGLLGHSSSIQSGIIVPSPDNTDTYFIFTAPYQTKGGLYYNFVDMTLDGGLGEVVTKNILLNDIVTEKLTAVKHANGSGKWVLYHKYPANEYLAYLA